MFYNARAPEVANLNLRADVRGSTSEFEFVFLIHEPTAILLKVGIGEDLEQVTDFVMLCSEMRISLQTRVSFHRSRS